MKKSNFFNQLIYKDKEGNEISMKKCGELLEDPEYKIIKQEKVEDKFVSTIWLGIPHMGNCGFGGSTYFETMIFDKKGYSKDLYRYETLEEAEIGHEAVVELVTHKKE